LALADERVGSQVTAASGGQFTAVVAATMTRLSGLTGWSHGQGSSRGPGCAAAAARAATGAMWPSASMRRGQGLSAGDPAFYGGRWAAVYDDHHRFGLVYLVFSSLFGLLSRQRQARCFAGVARVLDPGGVFVIEVSRHDRGRQRADTQMITFDGQGMHLRPVAIHYSWPAELDLMASQAGLRLAGRYAGWDRRPFSAASDSHVSVYQRA